jgi:O-methyltransferase
MRIMTTTPSARLPFPPCPAAARAALERHLRPPRELQLLYVAARLGLADELRGGPLAAAELARRVGANAAALARALRGLAAMGVVAAGEDGRYRLAAAGFLLCRHHPVSLHDDVLVHGELFPAWAGLLHAVETGETAFDHVFGRALFDRFGEDDGAGRRFAGYLARRTAAAARAVAAACDAAGRRRIVDVGGGEGALLAALLAAHPGARGVLFDRPAALAGARARLAPLAPRCELAAGDFFAAVPAGGDLYLLQAVLHDWDDERALSLLANCRRAIAPRGALLVIERPLDAPDSPQAIAGDLDMLVLTGGRERTVAEYAALLARAGFRLARVIATRGPFSVLESLPAPPSGACRTRRGSGRAGPSDRSAS